MDPGEWVLIPDVEFLEMYDKEENQEDCCRSFFGHDPETGCFFINKDYFICSSPHSPKPMNYTENVSFQLEQSDNDDDLVVNILPAIEPNFLPSVIAEKVQFPSLIYDQDDDDGLFEKSLEYQLVDSEIKLPMNCSNNSGRRIRIWTWSLKGFGAICSFGVAAATICFINFYNQQNHHHHQQIKKLQFQINANDKRIKQVVFEQATNLSEVMMSGTR